MELAQVAATFTGASGSGADSAKSKRKLDAAHAFFSPPARSPAPSPRGGSNTSNCLAFRGSTGGELGLPYLDSHPKVRRRGASSTSSTSSGSAGGQLDSPSRTRTLMPTRCASDGKMPHSFVDSPVSEAADSDNSRCTAGQACPKSPTMAALQQQKKSISPRDGISPRVGICSSPGLHHMQFPEDKSGDPQSAHKGPTSPSAAKPRSAAMSGCSANVTHSQSPSSLSSSSPSFTPPTPNKRVCSQQSKPTTATTATTGWMASPVQPRKRLLGASDSPHSAAACPADKRLSLSLEMDLESRSHATPAALSSGSSTSAATPLAVAAMARGSASAPKRAYQPPPRRNRNPGNLSLDLSQMDQPGLDVSGVTSAALRRNDQAAVCSQVTDFLFIGGAAAAKDKASLRRQGVTHVINCAASVAPAAFPSDFRYLSIRLRDHSSQDIARHFYTVFDFIETARRAGGRVFVHCVKGISRSPTMAIAYLMWLRRMGMYEALDFVRQARPIVDPNAGFIFQLTEWEQLHLEGHIQLRRPVVFRVDVPDASGEDEDTDDASCQEEKSLLVGPLSGVRTAFFREPTLETRARSFIVACAEYLFVWCGGDAGDAQVEAARDATQLLQRYEAFPLRCDVVAHGHEPEAFWRLVAREN